RGSRLSSPPDLRAAACTRVIDTGRLSGHDLAEAYLNRADGYFQSGERARAMPDYERAIALAPQDWGGYIRPGHSSTANHQPQLALQDFDTALRLLLSAPMPDAPVAVLARHMMLAFLYEDRGGANGALGQYTRALDDYNAAIEMSPTDPNGFVGRGS